MAFEMASLCHFELSDIPDFNIKWGYWFCISMPNFMKIGQIDADAYGIYCRLEFSEVRNFNAQSAVGDSGHHRTKFLSKSVKSLWRYGDLTVFNLLAICHLDFINFLTVMRPILHYLTKFCQDGSNHCWDTAIFVILEMTAAAIWIFRKSQF